MKITVNEQTQRFYLATGKWKSVVGHEIKVGKYRFCAIPLKDNVNVSEVTSGTKVFTIPMNLEIMMATESKKGSMKFFHKIGESLNRVIEGANDFNAQLEEMKKIAFDRLGKMPPIENIDMDWTLEQTEQAYMDKNATNHERQESGY